MDQLDPEKYYLNFKINWGVERYHFDLKFNMQVFGFVMHKLFLNSKELQRPSSLFKFYRPTQLNLNSLVERYLFFSHPSNFNDPYDCLSHQHEEIKSSSDESKVHIENLGVCCFSTERDSMQMWGHYTDSYKGFCLKFNNNDDFMQYQECLNIKSNVLYLNNFLSDHPNFTEAIQGVDDRITIKDLNEWIKDFVKYYYHYCSKDKTWSYEKEYRMISLCAEKCNRKLSFLKTNLKEIYIGYNMDESYFNLLVQILKSDYPHVRIFKVKPNFKHIKLDFEKI